MQLVSRLSSCATPLLPRFGTCDRFVTLMVGIFSAKQTARPDSILTSCWQFAPYLKEALAEECWKIVFLSKRIFRVPQEFALRNGAQAVEAISRLEIALVKGTENEVTVTPDEKRAVELLLARPITKDELCKLNAYLTFLGKTTLWRTLKACEELFILLQDTRLEALQTKMANIERASTESIESPFSAVYKLTPQDTRLLVVAADRNKLLLVLQRLQISFPNDEKLRTRWKKLQDLNESATAQHLRDLCKEGYQSGRICFYDWTINQVKDFQPFNIFFIFKHVLFGRMTHATLVVKDSANRASLSHVNSATQSHAIHYVGLPILGTLSYFSELDISSLLSTNISSDHQKFLQKHFTENFIKIASEEHSNIHFRWIWIVIFTSLFGHKSFFRHDLSKLNLTANQKQLCSSYIATVFLMALREVNTQLSILGYHEKIQDPFGEHEIINRIDIPRLLYHFKRLKVLKPVPIHPFISKVFVTQQL